MNVRGRQTGYLGALRALGAAALLCALLVFTVPAAAQQYSFRAYDQDDGLGNLTILCLLQDRRGLIWACTENGLYRYDGFRFERQDPPGSDGDTEYTNALEDSSGRLWVSTAGAVYVRGPRGWQTVEIDQLALQIERGQSMAPLGDKGIVAISDRRLLRILPQPRGTWRSQPYFSAEDIAAQPALGSLSSVTVDATGDLWLGCGKQICRIGRDGVQSWDSNSGVPTDQWTRLFIARDGTVWARSLTRVISLSPSGRSFHLHQPPAGSPPVPSDSLTFAEDRHGILTGEQQGVSLWNGRDWQHFGVDNGLPESRVNVLLTDREGSLWIGTDGRGIHRWLGFGLWQHWTTAQGLPSNLVWSATRDDADRLWIGTDLGIAILDRSSGTIAPAPAFAGEPLREIYSLARTRDGAIWAGERGGRLFRFASTGQAPQLVAKLPHINRLMLDSRGRLVVVGGTHAYFIDEPESASSPQNVVASAVLPSNSRLRDIVVEGPDHVWFLSRAGIYRLDGSHWTELRLRGGGSMIGYISGSIGADGSLWLGGDSSGLHHFRIDGDEAIELDDINSSVLGTRNVVFVRHDRRGWLWVGTDSGITLFDGKRWRRLESNSGLIWNDCDEGAFFDDEDGSVWIGTSSGLSTLTDPQAIEPRLPLQALIISARLGEYHLQPDIANLRLPWKRSALTLKLASPNFIAEKTLRFRYRLDGLDDAWDTTDSHELRYPPLAPGHYSFQLTVVDTASQEESPPAVLNFSITAPWWRSPWALGCYVLLFVLGLRAVLRWRVRLLLMRQHELERVVAERTEELEHDKRELIKAREALVERATRDSLTRLWNRAAILDILDHEIARARREHKPLAVLMVDIDNFKMVNDRYGHVVGDRVLRESADRLVAGVRPYDEVGRYGGEELLAVLPGLDRQIPNPRVEELHEAFTVRPFEPGGEPLQVTASFGVAWLPEEPITPEAFLHAADEALYRAKASGKNRVCYADDASIPQPATTTGDESRDDHANLHVL